MGAGQAGLQLGLGLLEHPEIEVTLYSDRTAEEVASGSLMATAILFQNKREIERELELDFWSDTVVSRNWNRRFHAAFRW